MKKLLLLFAVLMTAITAKAEDFILYTTSDGQALNVDYFNEFDTFGAHIVSHTYEDGQGKIQFDGDVQGIGNEAFSYCSTLTSIEIPNSVKTIGFLAFNQCTSLQSVVIPNSVHHIRPAAFGYCTSLKSVVLPNCLVEQGGFAYCPSLEYISGPFASNDNRCLIIGGILIAFAPAGLTSYEIPNSVQIIGDGAFVNCTELTSVVIPESVQEIVGYGFIGCYNLSSISGKFASDDNRCLIVDGTLISFAPAGLTEYIIPNSVTKIGEFAFKDSRELSSLVIPSSVTEIGKDAFNFCSGLQEITSLNPIPPSISIYTLNYQTLDASTCVLKVPYGSVEAYKEHKGWGYFKNIVGIEDPNAINSVTATANSARTYNLQGVEVGDSYRGIVIQNEKKILRK